MKTRVVLHSLNGDIWYIVQYKVFLIWYTWTDAFGNDVQYTDKQKAIIRANQLIAKHTKKIVYENNK